MNCSDNDESCNDLKFIICLWGSLSKQGRCQGFHDDIIMRDEGVSKSVKISVTSFIDDPYIVP